MSVAAALGAALAAWVTLGALGVLGPGPFTARVGVLPPWWVLGAFFFTGAAGLLGRRIAAGSRGSKRPAPPKSASATLLLSLLFLPWLPFSVPRAFLAWTGPIAYAVWAAVIASVALSRPWRWRERWPALTDPARAPWIAAAASAAFFGAIAVSAAPMVPGGDEPHYLVITQSILYDRDLKIENNHARRDYAPYFHGILRPDYLVRGKDAEIYSIHPPGLPGLIAPAFAIGGYMGAVVFLILIAAAGMALLWRAAYETVGDAGAAWFGTAAIATATPTAFHSFTIYPDTTAWVPALVGVRALINAGEARGRGPEARSLGLAGAALAVLPWIHSRFAFLAGGLGLFILLRLPRTRDGLRAAAAFLVVPIVSAALWFLFFYVVYGTVNPNAPYGTFARTQASWAFVPDGLLGVLFDQQFGLLLYAPVFFVVFGGWIAALRGQSPLSTSRKVTVPSRRLAVELAIVGVPYMIAVTYLRMWWGGWSAPVRFSVAVLVFGGIFAAIAWRRMSARGTRAVAVAALLVSAFTTIALAIVQRGRLAYNVRDGVSLWLEWLNPLVDLPRGFPSFFRGPASELILHSVVWLAAPVAAWLTVRHLARARLASRAALALATGAALALAAMTALTVVWTAQRAAAITPAPSQLAVLRTWSAWPGRAVGVRYRPFGLHPEVGASMRIAAPERLLTGRERPLFALPGWIPAGRYDLLGPRRAAPISGRILRGDDPVLTVAPDDTAITLPVDVPALLLHGPQSELSGRLLLQASDVRPIFDDRPGARRARRYGRTTAFFLDDGAFPEPDAFWVRGGSSAEVVLHSVPAVVRHRLLIRNGAVQNRLRLVSAAMTIDRSLKPGEELTLEVPLATRNGAGRLTIESASGFRPSAVDPASADQRYLGVWIQIR
jgi:hypothetical protein